MIVHVDATGNGRVCVAQLIETEQRSYWTYSLFDFSVKTHNEAEYFAALKAIEMASEPLIVYSDSQLVVNQLNRQWKINYPHLRALAERIWELIREKNLDVEFRWCPRKENYAGKFLNKHE